MVSSESLLAPGAVGGAGTAGAESGRRRDLVFDQAPLGMALVGTTGLLLRVNAAAGAIVGRFPRVLTGTALADVVHPADRGAVARQVDALVAGDLVHLRADTRLRHLDGRVIWVRVHASCVRDTDATPLCVMAQIEEITEQRLADAAVAEAEERFRTIFEMAPIGMILTDTEGVLLRANSAYGAIVGRDPDALRGTAVGHMTHPDDLEDNIAQIRSLVAGDVDTLSLEKRYLRADGRDVWASVSASCVRDASGSPLYLIGQIEDITERREMRERLAHAAIHDPLTDLPNRDLFVDRLEMALRRAKRGGHRVAVMFVDLDRFKMVNDSHGHEVGDRLLRAVADRMRSALRASDTLARFGGDEFTVLCDEVADETHVIEIADRLRSTMAEPLTEGDGETFVSFSMGIALSSDAEESGSTLLRHADIAMYRAKERGPARVEIFTPDDHLATDSRLRTSNELRGALERQELELRYQPYVDLHTHTMVGMEALVRWRHPTRGVLLPDAFVALAEDSGLIVPLGAWALGEACRQVAAWDVGRARAGLDEARLNISVNVAGLQLADPAFPDLVTGILETTGINPDRLWLELTESTLMRDPESTVTVLQRLRALGLHVVIDDFGTGFSSLAHLERFPVETLKIDGSFVREVDLRSADTAVVRAIIGLGDALGLSVIAEGVERQAQVPILQTLGCHLAQGFLFGLPLHPRDVGAFPTDDLRAWRADPGTTLP
ncbi:MAG TPA: EAL domain-containing protein [Acidimicrobiales bacterium]|nr:EAL domain-containing protein [Acidimicrobiales bacterium]